MRKISFKYIKAVNFLCFGPEGIEIHFDDYGNVIQVFGLVVETGRSNGSGKSTIPEIATYALYGKTIKPHNKIKTNIFHNKVGNKLHVEVHWDKYKVIRKRKPDKLELYELVDGQWKDISRGSGKIATQDLIISKIGMNYETFVNVVMFTDKNDEAFLECELADKRKIAENLLSLEKYRMYANTVKEMRKDLKDELKVLIRDYERMTLDRDSAAARIQSVENQNEQWVSNLKFEMKQLMEKIKSLKTEMQTTDEGAALLAWQKAQDSIARIRLEIEDCEGKKAESNEMHQKLQTKRDSYSTAAHKIKLDIQTIQQEIERANKEIASDMAFIEGIADKKGTRCPACLGLVGEDNHNHAVNSRKDNLAQLEFLIETHKSTLADKDKEATDKEGVIKKIRMHIAVLEGSRGEIDARISKLNQELARFSKVPRPEGDNVALLLEKEIDQLKKELIKKKGAFDSGKTPYTQILEDARNELQTKETECADKKKDLEEKESLLPYYDYWFEGFGDTGIRKLIISDVVPALNESIARWINVLLDGAYSLKLDSELNETIERNPADGDPFVYHAMSRGEQRTLNLSISRAFAHVMALSWGCIPSFIFLDEVGSNIDEIGKESVYKMILELSQEQQVFVTTHDKQLQDLLKGHSEVHLRRENGFTILSNEN